MRQNWKEVEIPEKMKKLETDKRGFPIPYIILIDDIGQAHFAINSDRKTDQCRRLKLCAICGKSMVTKFDIDMWLIGGPRSAFHPEGVYIDTPTHYECGKYALKVCPYLAARNYEKHLPPEKLSGRVVSKSRLITVDPTVDPTRPKIFTFIKIKYFLTIKHKLGYYIKPTVPYLDVEFWDKGVQLKDTVEIFSILADAGISSAGVAEKLNPTRS